MCPWKILKGARAIRVSMLFKKRCLARRYNLYQFSRLVEIRFRKNDTTTTRSCTHCSIMIGMNTVILCEMFDDSTLRIENKLAKHGHVMLANQIGTMICSICSNEENVKIDLV